MNLVIFHYHLLPGGVTDVIRLSVTALLKHCPEIGSVMLVSGRSENLENVRQKILRDIPSSSSDRLKTEVCSSIDYQENVRKTETASGLSASLLEQYGDEGALWLVHNYHLGKNTVFTDALLDCAEKTTQKILFYIHDFPECARFQNLRRIKNLNRSIYPVPGNLRYAVINSRDRDLLVRNGLPEQAVHLLVNPVPPAKHPSGDRVKLLQQLERRFSADFPAFSKNGKILFYPVRTIRRKNIMEAGFLMNLMQEPVNLIVTLPGISPLEKEYSDLVESAFKKGLIPGVWGTGLTEEDDDFNFKMLQASCDGVISSSVQEGFGYLFLNALYWKKPLISRDLDILDGIRETFDNYPAVFYSSCLVTLDKEERYWLENQYQTHLQSLQPVFPEDAFLVLQERFQTVLSNDHTDFSYLPPLLQYRVLEHLKDQAYLEECRHLNKFILDQFRQSLGGGNVPDKTQALNRVFGEKAYSKAFQKLMQSYDQEIKVDNAGSVQDGLIRSFAHPDYFRLLYQ